jgi:tetratricopeptide (TPR) repeat protein
MDEWDAAAMDVEIRRPVFLLKMPAYAVAALREQRKSAAAGAPNPQVEAGQYAAAIEKFGLVIASDPKNLDALFGRGWANLALGNRNEAADDFEMVMAISPKYNGALYTVFGLLNEGTDEPIRAAANFTRAAKMYTESKSTAALEATTAKLKDLSGKGLRLTTDVAGLVIKGAPADVATLLSTNTKDAGGALFNAAVQKLNQKRFQEAISLLNQVIASRPV